MTLFYELRKHGKLAAKRNPMYDKNRFGKYAMYAMAAFWAGYLIFFGTTFAFAFDTNSMEPYHIMNSGLIFILALDFILRFPLQKTPTQEVKPYLLLPVKRNTVIDFLLIRSGLSSYNFFWLFLFVPFAIITLPKFFGIWGVITYCTGIWLLMVFNNYWFLLCRTLIGERLWWICLPVLVYGGIAAGLLIPDKSPIGEVGEYMRLELKMLLRNKVCKNSLRMVIIVVVAFSLILGFTDIYDGTGMKNFITVYNFAIFGILFLLQIMSYEGNYIDGLMSRKESIYSLLRAKYMLYSIGILLPLILSIPAMVMGKIEVLTAFSWAIFTIGFIYFCLFQMAVYNTKTVPLNVKLAGRQNTGTGLQNLISFATFGIPLLLYAVLKMTIGETATAWMLLAIGLVFILTSRFWLKNVYDRFMKRRYKNMEGFRDSRQQ